MRLQPSRSAVQVWVLLGVFTGWIGCGDSGGGSTPAPDAGPVERANLEIVPPPGQDIGLRPGGEVTLKVRYTDAEFNPIAGGVVEFSLLGDAGGATLQEPNARTGSDGTAQMVLRAGFDEAAFFVEVAAAGAGTIRYAVAVSNAGFGDLDVSLVHLGLRPESDFVRLDVLLYMDGSCATLDPLEPEQAQKIRHLTLFSESARFEFLPVDGWYSAAVQGVDASDHPIGWGCVDLAEGDLKEGIVLGTSVQVHDLEVLPESRYLLENELLLNLGESPSLTLALDRWVDLGDCDNDPAEAILDCIVSALNDPGTPPEALTCDGIPVSSMARQVAARRGVVQGGCRSDVDVQSRESLDKRLTDALSSVSQVSVLKSLSSGGTDALGTVDVHTSMDLTAVSAPSTFVADHTMQGVRFPLVPSEVFLDLSEFLLPSPTARGILVTRQVDEPSTLLFADHSVTLRLPRLILQALIEGYLGGFPGTDALQALEGVLDQMRPPSWYPPGDPLEACPLLDAYVCHLLSQPMGCLQDGCTRGLTALAHRLRSGFDSAEATGPDLTFANGQGPLGDSDGDLMAETMGSDLEPGLWDVLVQFAEPQPANVSATFLGYAPTIPLVQ